MKSRESRERVPLLTFKQWTCRRNNVDEDGEDQDEDAMTMTMTLMLGRHTYAKVFQLPHRQGLDFTFVTPAQGEGTFQIIQLKNRVVSRSLFFSRSRSRFASASVFLVFSFFFLFLLFCGFDYVFMKRTQRTQGRAKGVSILK